MDILPLEFSTQGCSAQAASEYAITRSHMCVCVCLCVPLYCWWLSFRIVSRLSVINVPRRVGPKKIYHKQEGRQSAQGKEEDGARGGESGAEWETK